MGAVSWIQVRPVEIGPRCQSADKGSGSGYNLVLECFEQKGIKKSPFNWKMTCKSVRCVQRSDRPFGSDSAGGALAYEIVAFPLQS